MPLPVKVSYHPYLVVAFYLNCLPNEWLHRIPRSTRYDWSNKQLSHLFGYDWYCQNQQIFHTLNAVAASKQLLRVNTALLRIIALKRFIVRYNCRVKNNILQINAVVLSNIRKITSIILLETALKGLQQSYAWYLRLRADQRCTSSLLSLCLVKHPAQLLAREVQAIKTYCCDKRFLNWPLASVYHQLIRDRTAVFSMSTFYKYTSLLQLKRSTGPHRRKNHHTGIRAMAPLQILHADTTIFRTADNRKNYIYLVQDNFSRAILTHRISETCKACFVFENLQYVHQQYLSPSGLGQSRVITDDGSENKGAVIDWAKGSSSPPVQLLIAQQDIEFSNSMIEAANKQLKYRFLYHYHIPDAAALAVYLYKAIEDYNNRPHDVLSGLTPLEVLNGIRVDGSVIRQLSEQTTIARFAENKRAKCCYYSF